MKHPLLLLLVFLFISSCTSYKKIDREYTPVSFEGVTPPASPDYSNPDHWAALPSKTDGADSLPIGFVDGQAEAQVDIFFIHPTTYSYTDSGWNGSIDDQIAKNLITERVLPNQASLFNGVGRVYAPFYRQAHLKSYYNIENGGEQAIFFAYQDVRRAFLYYMENFNEGRPFIIASHSQGTTHAILLTKEFIDGKPLQEKLVAAYLIGMPIPKDTFSTLPPCDQPGGFGCYNSWCTFVKGHLPPTYESFYKGANVTNPITWTLNDSNYTDKDKHKGVIYYNYELKLKQSISSASNNGILWIKKPNIWFRLFIWKKNWHIADYNLFWVNIRENLDAQVKAYFEAQEIEAIGQ